MLLTRPDLLLRLEALLVLLGSLASYSALHGRWGLFAILFLAPDLSLLGYLAPNKRLAAAFYNAVHSYAGPLITGLCAWHFHSQIGGQLALVWAAHIALDRMLGFGLKYAQAFQPTHIQSARVFRAS